MELCEYPREVDDGNCDYEGDECAGCDGGPFYPSGEVFPESASCDGESCDDCDEHGVSSPYGCVYNVLHDGFDVDHVEYFSFDEELNGSLRCVDLDLQSLLVVVEVLLYLVGGAVEFLDW